MTGRKSPISPDSDTVLQSEQTVVQSPLEVEPSEKTIVQAASDPNVEKGSAKESRVQQDSDSTVIKPVSGHVVGPEAAPSVSVETQPRPTPVGIGDVIRGRYKLLAQLGEGGTGRVFKAEDLILVEAGDPNPYVALKVLNFDSHQKSLKALHSEAQKAKQLAHPNIVTVFDVDRDDALVFMTMEYLEGSPLDVLLAGNPHGLDPKQARLVANDIVAGLSHAHRQSIAHVDLKPGNVFLTKDNRAKLLDFGIARALGPDAIRGVLEGYTPAYAAAAVLAGGRPGAKDDLYGLACIIYECFTGRHPYSRKTAQIAREQGLRPKPVNAFTKAEWRTINQVLVGASKLETADEFARKINPSRVRGVVALAVFVALIAVLWGALREPPRGPSVPFAELPAPTQQLIEDELALAAEYAALGETEDVVLAYERVLNLHPGNLRASKGFDQAISGLIDDCLKQSAEVLAGCRDWAAELLAQSDHLPERARKSLNNFAERAD